jgi:hypothetical protein
MRLKSFPGNFLYHPLRLVRYPKSRPAPPSMSYKPGRGWAMDTQLLSMNSQPRECHGKSLTYFSFFISSSPLVEQPLGRMVSAGYGLPKVHPGPPCSTLFRLVGEPPLVAVSGVARPQGWRPAAVFYPIGHPEPCAYASCPLVEQPTI